MKQNLQMLQGIIQNWQKMTSGHQEKKVPNLEQMKSRKQRNLLQKSQMD